MASRALLLCKHGVPWERVMAMSVQETDALIGLLTGGDSPGEQALTKKVKRKGR